MLRRAPVRALHRAGPHLLLMCLASIAYLGGSAVAEDGPAQLEDIGPLRMELRAYPQTMLNPGRSHLIAHVMGADTGELYYCPRQEWEWPEGYSMREPTCAPYHPDAHIDRFYDAWVDFKTPGDHEVSITLSKHGRTLQTARVLVKVVGR